MSCKLWHKILCEAGCLPDGIITQIKRAAKVDLNMRYTDLRDVNYTLEEKRWLKLLCHVANSRNFWSEVKKVNKKSKGQSSVSSIDGVSGDLSISNLWGAKLRDLFSSQDVTERDNLHADVMNKISPNDLANLNISPGSVAT